MLNFDLQNHRPLREIVYEQLKMQILRGKIVPGTRMSWLTKWVSAERR